MSVSVGGPMHGVIYESLLAVVLGITARSDSTLLSRPLSCSFLIKKVSANAISSAKFRSVSVRCPLSLFPGERIQPTGRAAESLPKPSFFRNLTLRLKSRRAGYDILEKPSLSVVTPEDMQRILAGISRSTKKQLGIRSTKDIEDLSAAKRIGMMAMLLGRCKANKWYRRKNEEVFPDEIILIYLISKADLKEGDKQKLPDVVNMALICISDIYKYSLDNFKPDLKSAAIAAFDRIYQDHSKLGLKYEAIDDYKTIEHHS
ncbi:hypothetical protein Pst134EB_030755 [Puccinia striiformis f. sp. tritici]|nr:hypothetical protein Pst134EB_030755 [Puccinia striiformis f. sp. tritici]